MPYTTEERGILNPFAIESTMYVAEASTPAQQKRDAMIGVAAAVFLGLGLFIATSA